MGPLARRLEDTQDALRIAESHREQAEAELAMARVRLTADNQRLQRETVALEAALRYAQGLLRLQDLNVEADQVNGFLEGYRKATR